jgi:carboxypeptidase C (cathepsin A)
MECFHAMKTGIAFVLLCASVFAQAPAAAPKPATLPEPPAPVTRQHEISIGGATLRYKSVAGLMPIKNARGDIEAHIYSTAYLLDGAADPSKRRLVFAFNGGPGSSSVWLHLGAIGPRRVRMNDDGTMPAAPYHMEPNEGTWLDHADLVFIDPVGTGYSRAASPEIAKKFFGLRGDIESVGEFIRMWLTRHRRWLSPVFLAGESYGTTRAAGLSRWLVDRGIALNGIALVSTILNFQTVRFAPGNDLAYALMLPTYTATAWYHKRLAAGLQKDLRAALKESESYALGGYMEALNKGDRLTAAEREAAIRQLARLTGLEERYVARADLRVTLSQFMAELLRDKGLVPGRLDSRLTGPAQRGISDAPEFDPSMTAIRPPYTAAWNHYVRADLGYENDAEYHILGGGIGPWDWDASNRYADVGDALRSAMARNPYMKIYVGQGYYDAATPYYAAWYTLEHMGLAPELRANIRRHEYESGHMYYIHVDSLRRMKKDIAGFLEWAAPVRP